MGPLFCRLVEDFLGEFERREPQYLPRFPLIFPQGGPRKDLYRRHFSLKPNDHAALDQAIETAVRHLRQRGVPVEYSDGPVDSASLILFHGILDALAADQGSLPLRGTPQSQRPAGETLDEILRDTYDERRTPDGRRYIVSRSGTRPLLVVSALGIPLSIWNKLLCDSSHDYRIVMVENRCGDFLSGGMSSDADLTRHADDISEVLKLEGTAGLHVLGWCNGGRIAIDLVTRGVHDIRSLVLLSPTLRGTEGASEPGSPFEDRLQQIFKTVTRNAALAMPLVKMLSRFTQPPDWDGLAEDPEGRAKALFALPARESAAAFLAPMSAPAFLVNYARRTAADEAYPMAATLRKLADSRVPALLITGSHDTMVSNQATCAALVNSGSSVTHASVAGAGHYIQDLQYPYFRWLLDSFTESGRLSDAALRVSVQQFHNQFSVA